MRRMGRVAAVGVAALAVVVLAGTAAVAVTAAAPGAQAAASGAAGAANPVTADATILPRVVTGRAYAEYLAARRALGHLPRGASWPVGVPVQIGYGAVGDGLLRPGSGTDTAYFTYLCAWESEMLDAHAAESGRRLAMAGGHIADFFASAWARRVSADGVWDAAVYLPTRSGNFAGMEYDLPGSCRRAAVPFAAS